jgi:hypothetical protein
VDKAKFRALFTVHALFTASVDPQTVAFTADSQTSWAWRHCRERAAYANAVKLLAKFGAILDHMVEKAIYVTDIDVAFAERLVGISFTVVLPIWLGEADVHTAFHH